MKANKQLNEIVLRKQAIIKLFDEISTHAHAREGIDFSSHMFHKQTFKFKICS